MVLLPILFISRVHGPLLSASKGSFQKQQKFSSAIFPRLVIGLEEAKQRCMYRSICWLCPLDKSLRRWFEGMHILHVFQRLCLVAGCPLGLRDMVAKPTKLATKIWHQDHCRQHNQSKTCENTGCQTVCIVLQ